MIALALLAFSSFVNIQNAVLLLMQSTDCLWFLRTNEQYINIINESIEILVLNFTGFDIYKSGSNKSKFQFNIII